MLIKLNHENGIPLYLQLQEEIKHSIATGDLVPGDRLPSTRALSKQLNVAPQTVMQAYQSLERDGLVVTQRGRGTSVAPLEIGVARPSALFDLLAGPIGEARQRGFDLDEVQREVRRIYQRTPDFGARICVVDRYGELAASYDQQLTAALSDLPVTISHYTVDDSKGSDEVRDDLTDYTQLVVSLYSLSALKRVRLDQDPRVVLFALTYKYEVLARIASIPAGIPVGIVGVRPEYVHTVLNLLHADKDEAPQATTALVSDTDQMAHVVDRSQVVLYTPPCRDDLFRLATPSVELIELSPIMADDSVGKVRQLIEDQFQQEGRALVRGGDGNDSATAAMKDPGGRGATGEWR